MKNTFLNVIRDEYPNEEVTRLVFADWCLENEPNLESKLRKHPIIDGLYIHPNYEYGYGHGYGYGSGHGHGYGYGYEFGSGHGHGFVGSGSGSGHGYKYQNFILNMPKLHKNQLILLPYSLVICGFIQEHIQPYQFKLTNASIIISHNLSWHEVANNTNRNINTRKLNTITIGPQIFHSIDWEGNLP